MSRTPDPQIEFAANPDEEHQRIKQTNAAAILALWMLGVRLLHFRASFAWQQLTAPEAPFKDWTDYVARGLGVSTATAYRAMDAACFPYWCSELLGIERMSLLKKITDLTTVDENPEQAMALRLPLAEGGTKPVTEMTVRELDGAYGLLRDGKAQAERPEGTEQPDPGAEVQRTAAAAISTWMSAAQVRAHRKNRGLVIDLNDVPHEHAADVFSSLGRAFRP
jgi:hypothetical protein